MAPLVAPRDARVARLRQRGRQAVVDGRNAHGRSPPRAPGPRGATGPSWTPDKLFGFFYPDNNAGDDDIAGTAFALARRVQRRLAELPRRRRSSGRRGGTGAKLTLRRSPPRRAACSTAWRRSRSTRPPATTRTRTPAASRCRSRSRPSGSAPGRRQRAANEPLRQERSRPTTSPRRRRRDGRRDHLDARHRDLRLRPRAGRPATRNELVKRSLAYLLPPTAGYDGADDRRVQVSGRRSVATPNDPSSSS